VNQQAAGINLSSPPSPLSAFRDRAWSKASAPKLEFDEDLNRKVQLAFAAAIITMLAEGTICYRGLVATVESDQWVRLSCEALCRGMPEAAPRNGCGSSNAQWLAGVTGWRLQWR
jgi:hypothetical protein